MPFFSRSKIIWLILERIDQVSRRDGRGDLLDKPGLVGVTPNTRGMGQQMPQHDFLAAWEIGEKSRQLVVHAELALFLQFQDSRGGKLLGDRTDPEFGLGSDDRAVGDVG